MALGLVTTVVIGVGIITFLVFLEVKHFSGSAIKTWWRGQNHESRSDVWMPFHVTSAISSVVPPLMLFLSFTFTMFNNFVAATSTHCGHYNFMPSISACIANNPQRCIWRVGVAFYAWQRVLAGFAHHQAFKLATQSSPIPWRNLSRLFVNTLEQCCLILLSYVSSDDNNAVHTLGFAGFATSTVLNIPMKLSICRHWHRLSVTSGRNDSHTAKVAIRWITTALIINYLAFAGVLYWYAVHNMSCRRYAYSYFAFSEWTFVWSNIAFHHSEWVILQGVDLKLQIPHCGECKISAQIVDDDMGQHVRSKNS